MIVTCGSCLTKFRLDDYKISTEGTKVRCSRCRHVFLVIPPLVIKEEILEDFKSSAQYYKALMEPDQPMMEVSPTSGSETIDKAAKDEKPSTPYSKGGTKFPQKPVIEERIKVKTFKIGNNSFGIEWNIQN